LLRGADGSFGWTDVPGCRRLRQLSPKSGIAGGRQKPPRVFITLSNGVTTAKTHLEHIFLKTGVTRQAELMPSLDRVDLPNEIEHVVDASPFVFRRFRVPHRFLWGVFLSW